jgi:hypothetical protein
MDVTNNAKSDAQRREEADAAKQKEDEDNALLQGDMETAHTEKE